MPLAVLAFGSWPAEVIACQEGRVFGKKFIGPSLLLHRFLTMDSGVELKFIMTLGVWSRLSHHKQVRSRKAGRDSVAELSSGSQTRDKREDAND